ncbi:mitochondrial genome maintenance exonuclease 1 isoform X2 [Augochlora pura]
MFNKKHLLCSLHIYRFNIGCSSRQCGRNLSFTNTIFQKLKVKVEEEVLEIEYKVGTEPIKKCQENIKHEIEDKRIKEETVTVSNSAAIEKTIPINTLTTEKKYDTSSSSYVQLRDNDKTPFVFNTETITSYPIVGSPDIIASLMKNKKQSLIPSVSEILRETMPEESKDALESWQKRMIEDIGYEQFFNYTKELRRTGKLLHRYIQNQLEHKDVPLYPEIELAYKSVKPFLSQIYPQKLEACVTHPNLMYYGFVDCIAVYRDELCVIDWKKSDKKRPTLASTHDAPIQISAYIGAVNASHLLPYMVTKGLIVIAYTNGEDASVYEIEDQLLQRKWDNWLQRLKSFYNNPKKKSFSEA